MNGSSDSQVTGRGGCGRGLLGHACACARVLTCMLGCLSNLAVVGLRRKHSLFAVARTRGSSLPHSQSPAPSFPSFPCPVASRLREKHCIRLRASGTSLQLRRKSWAGLWREVQLYGWPRSFTAPLPRAPRTRCCSWALTERQGWGPAVDRGWGSWSCPLPSSPTGVHWCLKCSRSLGPYVPKLKL